MSSGHDGTIAGCVYEHLIGSKTLVIAFSSLDDHRERTGKFDFFYLTKQTKFSVVLVRDVGNTWFHNPVDRDRRSKDHLTRYLLDISSRFDRVICLGSSMGAYGAILIGRAIGAHKIIAFAPQTFLGVEETGEIGDQRYTKHLKRIEDLGIEANATSLSTLSQEWDGSLTIYIGDTDHHDQIHADRLVGRSGVSVIALKDLGHGLINPLKTAGILNSILAAALDTDEPYDPSGPMDAFKSTYRHTLALSRNMVADPTKGSIELSAEILNCSDHVWPSSETGRVKIFYWVVYLDRGIEVTHGELPVTGEPLAPNGSSSETIKIDFRALSAGHYEAHINLGVGKTKLHEIGSRASRVGFEVVNVALPSFVDCQVAGRLNLESDGQSSIDAATWSTRETGLLHFPVSGKRLHTEAGVLQNGRVTIDTVAGGFGIIGPFIPLQAGFYEGTFIFDGKPPVGEVTIDVVDVKNHGGQIYAMKRFTFDSERSLAVTWKLPEYTECLEVRLFCQPGFSGSVESLAIKSFL